MNNKKLSTSITSGEIKSLNEIYEELKSFKPVTIRSDEDGHKYIIPKELNNEFTELLDKLIAYEYEDLELLNEYLNKFEQYRTGGDINNKQLYIKL